MPSRWGLDLETENVKDPHPYLFGHRTGLEDVPLVIHSLERASSAPCIYILWALVKKHPEIKGIAAEEDLPLQTHHLDFVVLVQDPLPHLLFSEIKGDYAISQSPC